MPENNPSTQVPEALLTVRETADLLGVEPTRIGQLLADHVLVSVEVAGQRMIPAECLVELPADRHYAVELKAPEEGKVRVVRATHEPLPHLRGTALVLHDGGYTDEEIVRWLWEPNRWLDARPIEALRRGSHKAVNRVASTQAW